MRAKNNKGLKRTIPISVLLLKGENSGVCMYCQLYVDVKLTVVEKQLYNDTFDVRAENPLLSVFAVQLNTGIDFK